MKRQDGSWDVFDDYVLDFAVERLRIGEKVAIVTLVHCEGSSPRPLGAQMAIAESGSWVGYLSGGCIERAVVAEAIDALRAGENRRVRYGRGSKYMDIQLPCGSAIELVFDVNLNLSELEAIDATLHCRLPASAQIPFGDDAGGFIQRYAPRTRLIVAGTGPSAVQLCKLAFLTGVEVVLYSPDEATRDEILRAGSIEIVLLQAPTSLPTIHADRHTAIVLMFHDHTWETKLLPFMLQTDAFYIGALGSRRTHSRRLEDLALLGHDPKQLARISGPAGLFESGKTAPEIAVSILAEIVKERRIRRGSAVQEGHAYHVKCSGTPLFALKSH